MIKFFRKIRQNLIMNSQTNKYFKYAIGEIILVVIGILIALQINNWNQNRINNSKLRDYITEIIKDLKNDTTTIHIELDFTKKRIQTTKSFLALKDYSTLTIDSLEKNLETFYSKVPFNSSAFKKLESSGITNYGEYESLIEDLKIYYNYIIPDFIESSETHNRAVDQEDNYWRYNQNSYEFTYNNELESRQKKEDSKKNLIILLQSPTARNILKIDYRRNERAIEALNILNDRLIKLIETTETTLND